MKLFYFNGCTHGIYKLYCFVILMLFAKIKKSFVNMRVLCSGKVKDNKKSTRFRKKSSTFFV